MSWFTLTELLAKQNQALHRALTCHLAGKIVLILVQQRKYELQAIDMADELMVGSGRALPPRWTNLLQPGSKLCMNALVGGVGRHSSSQFLCPACSEPVPVDGTYDESGWLKWYVPLVDMLCCSVLDLQKFSMSVQDSDLNVYR